MWNRDYRTGSSGRASPATSQIPLQGPDLAYIPPVAAAPPIYAPATEPALTGTSLGGTNAEDATELAAAMVTDEGETTANEAQSDEAAAASAILDAPLGASLSSEKPVARLSQDRKDKLDALGFVWSLRSKRIDDHWETMFQQLKAYKEKHGDCLVPSRYEENQKLGKWVETQRYEYTKLQRAASGAVESKEAREEADAVAAAAAQGKPRSSQPRLTEERLQRLNSIGFEWKVKHKMKRYYDKQWDQVI